MDENHGTSSLEFLTSVYRNSENFRLSKVTASYPIIEDESIQKTIDGNDIYLEEEEHDSWESDGDLSGRNSSIHHDFSQYFKQARFTFPSLPQFGIRLVSADEATTNFHQRLEAKKNKNNAFKLLATPSYRAPHATTSFLSLFPPVSSAIMTRKISRILGTTLKTTFTSTESIKNPEKRPQILTSTSTPHRQAHNTLYSNNKSNSLGTSKDTASKFKTSWKMTPSSLPILKDQSVASLSELSVNEDQKEYLIKTTKNLNSLSGATKVHAILSSTTSSTTMTPHSTLTTPAAQGESKKNDENRDTLDMHVRNLISMTGLKNKLPLESYRAKSSLLNVIQTKSTSLVSRERDYNFRLTTDVNTPYDAVDKDYYIDENEKNNLNTADYELDQYSDDAEEVKQISTSDIKKKSSYTATQTKILKIQSKEAEETIEKEEEEEEEEDIDETLQNTMSQRPFIPIAGQLSKNLEAALVSMIKQRVQNKNNEKAVVKAQQTSTLTTEATKIPFVTAYDKTVRKSTSETLLEPKKYKTNQESVLKRLRVRAKIPDSWLLRPYFAFEGPLIMDLPGNSDSRGQVERTAEKESGSLREFRFIG